MTLDQNLANLDTFQAALAAAIRNPASGNLRAAAGAGSGKTFSLVTAVAAAIVLDGVDPASIVATTFTNKAGRVLTDRLGALLPKSAINALRVGTMHGLALRALRNNPGTSPHGWAMSRCIDLDGKTRQPDVPAAAILWTSILGWGAVPASGAKGLDLDLDGKGLRWKDYALLEGLCREATVLTGATLPPDLATRARRLPSFDLAARMFRDAKIAARSFDFTDALLVYLERLRDGSMRTAARLVLVDESQDNSGAQLETAGIIAANGDGRLVLIGDARQSIYKFRGATPEIFMAADVRYGATTLDLPVNYRSGRKIVELGNAVAEGQAWSVGAPSIAARDLDGVVRVLGGHENAACEAEAVADEIAARISEGSARPGDFAILTRTNSMAGPFELALVQRKIPVRVVRGQPFFRRSEVLDFMAYVLLINQDHAKPLGRICNRPKRFLGRAFTDAVTARLGVGLLDALAAVGPTLRGGSRQGAADLRASIAKIRSLPWPEAAQHIAALLRPPPSPVEDGGDDDRSGVFAVCAGLACAFESAAEFVEYADRCAGIVQANDDDVSACVTISTIHGYKGLESPIVYLPCSDGVLPHRRADEKQLPEEQRLMYVAVTRARDELVLTWAEKDVFGKAAGPSEFLEFVVEVSDAV
jgi:superfamily I DNA/RNA helicase